jgi:O-antigen/teichoic acid export membrane protein
MSQPADPPPAERHTTRDVQRQAVTGSLWTIASTAAAIPVTLVSLVVAGRVLGPEAFGKYSLYSFYLPLAQMVVDLGLSSAIVWSATTGRVSDPDLVRRTLRTAVSWNLFKVPLLGALGVWLLRSNIAAAISLAAVLAVILATAGMGVAVTADRRFKQLSQIALVANGISAIAAAVLAVVTRSAEWTTVGYWGGRAVVTPLYWLAAPAELRWASITPGRFSLDRRSWSFGLSSYAASVLTTWIFGRSELVFLQRHGSAVDLGRFALTTTVAQRATLLADALYGALGGAMMALRSMDRVAYLSALMRSLRMTTLLAIACSVTVAPVVSIVGTRIFGHAYGDVIATTAVLLQLALVKTANEPVNSWIFGERRSRALLVPGAVAAGTDVVLCLLLIPSHPFAGAVTANITSTVLYIVLTDVSARLPAAGSRQLVACLARVVGVGAISAGIIALPLAESTVLRTLLATVLVLAGSIALLAVLPPLFDDRERAAVRANLPRIVRLPFAVALLVFNGGTVYRRLRPAPAEAS